MIVVVIFYYYYLYFIVVCNVTDKGLNLLELLCTDNMKTNQYIFHFLP